MFSSHFLFHNFALSENNRSKLLSPKINSNNTEDYYKSSPNFQHHTFLMPRSKPQGWCLVTAYRAVIKQSVYYTSTMQQERNYFRQLKLRLIGYYSAKPPTHYMLTKHFFTLSKPKSSPTCNF